MLTAQSYSSDHKEMGPRYQFTGQTTDTRTASRKYGRPEDTQEEMVHKSGGGLRVEQVGM